jgi:hypothetical protein
MSKKEAVPLSVMTGSGSSFSAAGKKYTITPLKLKDVPDFVNDQLSITSQLFNIVNPEAREKLAKWLPKCVFDANGEPVTLEKAMDDGWDLSDLRKAVEKLCDLSG